MKEYNTDLHIHGPFAGGTSKNICVEKTAEMGYYKGLQINPVGDLTHKKWFDTVFSKLELDGENYYFDFKTNFGDERCYFILSTEVQAKDRTHHLILFPNKRSILEFREKIKSYCKGLDGPMNGRPWLDLNSEEIAKICVDLNLIFGPAHAFTPYFGVYAHYNSLKEAYGKYFENINFLELGLSSDSYLTNDILELKNIPFLSNSDAHSFWPHRLGREFNVFNLQNPNYYEIEKALKNKDGRKINLNVGLNPKEGMYHKTRCKNCLTFYSLEDAEKLNWRCPCKGIIKKGVKERIEEITNKKKQKYERPEYKHILSLSEIICLATNNTNPLSEKVQKIWTDYINLGINEINVLLKLKEEALNEVNEDITKYILAFRKGYVSYFPGGAGEYGKPIIGFSENENKEIEKKINLDLERKLYLNALQNINLNKKFHNQKKLLDY